MDQVPVQMPYTPPPLGGSFALDTPLYDIQLLTRCKIIMLGDKVIPTSC